METESTSTVSIEAAAIETPKPGLLDNARAIVSEKAQLITANRELTRRNGELTATLAQLTTERDTMAAELTTLHQERTDLQAALATAQAEKKEVDKEVVHQLATAGLPENVLPAASIATAGGDIIEQFNAITDQKERTAFYHKHQAKLIAAKERARTTPLN